VLAYSAARSGLHLHGLNSNTVAFRTAPVEDVAKFAAAWGFLPPRWRSFADLRALQAFTDAVGETGAWEGEAIEGFVVRTRMPAVDADRAPAASSSTARPPYGPGQDWFFKVKYEEPYLMYRDWRELTRTTLAEHKAWKEQVQAARERQQARAGAAKASEAQREAAPAVKPAEPALPPKSAESETPPQQAASADAPPAEKLSKNAAKKLAKAAHRADDAKRKAAGEIAKPAAGSGAALPPPPPPVKPRSSRPETKVYVHWVHARVYGSPDGRVRPEPALFAHFDSGRGIIALRERYLEWLQTEEGRQELLAVGGTVAERPRSDPFTHTLVVPVGVPGCGKTVLSLALAHLFPDVLHQQADDVTGKKAGPAFIRAIGKALGSSTTVIADRNNHCFRHRTELVDEARKFETRALQIAAAKAKSKPDAEQAKPASAPRVRLVALAYALETVPLNTLHRVCSQRILARGRNHQSLRADAKGASGTKEHEVILWRFLEEVQPFQTGGKGEGTEGAADERFDDVVRLDVQASEGDNLAKAVDALVPLLGCERPRDEALAAALAHAHAYKAPVTRKGKDAAPAEGEAESATTVKGARYYGLTVEVDPFAALAPILRARAADSPAHAEARDFLQRLSRDGRINKSPHVTLVHHMELCKPSEDAPEAPLQPTPEQQHAQAKWERYAALCAPGAAEAQFAIHLDRIAWDGRVMTFGVGHVESGELRDFDTLQRGPRGDADGAWTPHVTIGTVSDEVRPFEANRVLRDADAGAGEGVQLLRLENAELVATGWLRGMFR
jgi:tRNA ligase